MRLTLLAALSAFAIATPALAEHHEHKKMEKAGADIVDTAVAAGKFTTLVAAVQAAGLEDALRADGDKTVFAPTDEAFAALPAGTVEELLKPENKEKLAAILTYHVVAGKTLSGDLAGKTLDVETLNGASVAVDGTDGVTVGGARVIKADVLASNGVIHVIDKVLMPPAAE
jgi:uncharacterized surface protein with fasciclin (FAS1) repeats